MGAQRPPRILTNKATDVTGGLKNDVTKTSQLSKRSHTSNKARPESFQGGLCCLCKEILKTMSVPERSPHIRVLPRANTLDIILKNTHFPDGLLSETDRIQCRAEWKDGIPVLVFQFKSAVHDFSEPLVPAELKNSEQGWLDRQPIQLRLLLADSVITDQVTERTFFLAKNESDEIRKVFELSKAKTIPSGM